MTWLQQKLMRAQSTLQIAWKTPETYLALYKDCSKWQTHQHFEHIISLGSEVYKPTNLLNLHQNIIATYQKL
jgi:hypothetical protein